MKKILKKIIPHKVKSKIKSVIKNKDFNNFKKEAIILSSADLIEGFIKAGIKKGDILFIHSSLKGLGYIEGGPQTVIKALKETVGNEGTLIFPVFTINMSMEQTLNDPSHLFNPSSSLSTVGSISNTFLKGENIHRSLHPTHSVAAWGKHAEDIVKNHHLAKTNFGGGTPFGRFLDLNGKLMGLGINYNNVTFYHTYEDLNLEKFPNVYLKTPIASRIINFNNEKVEVETLCHNLDFHKTRIEKNPEVEAYFSNYFEKNNISLKTQIGQGNIWWMHSKQVIETLDILYKQNITIYNIK